MTIVAALQLLR